MLRYWLPLPIFHAIATRRDYAAEGAMARCRAAATALQARCAAQRRGAQRERRRAAQACAPRATRVRAAHERACACAQRARQRAYSARGLFRLADCLLLPSLLPLFTIFFHFHLSPPDCLTFTFDAVFIIFHVITPLRLMPDDSSMFSPRRFIFRFYAAPLAAT
jgi:hypothetical protein